MKTINYLKAKAQMLYIKVFFDRLSGEIFKHGREELMTFPHGLILDVGIATTGLLSCHSLKDLVFSLFY